ncbi:hypothetical protein [Nitratireductor pacificus]|uniref:Uncharacterized protein n=1 Tax=Nitratireductor pacificus pht-3B TaxID=391937 RepID=K2MIT6_9HYPH|nr:hypothetical protein [Nitratireductor pacificus]EKF20610.1 hypothetical protein NA2_02459 [Nitratireductor pacificus pht-3B]
MTEPKQENRKPDAEKSGGRNDRLAAALRANLARRKEQARSRRKGKADERPDGLQPGPQDAKP